MSFNEGVTIDTSSVSRGGGGRRVGGAPIAVGGGIGGLILLLLTLFLNGGIGGDPTSSGVEPASGAGDLATECRTGADANENIDCRIIATENSLDAYWGPAMAELGQPYQRPRTTIFSGSTNTGCGAATSQVGPFYCPLDQTMYFDSSFFQVLTDRFGSSGGPLAQEYVVAHEFGHHIENLLGLLGASQRDPRGPESGAVRIELMADCLSGVWARHASNTPDEDTGVPFLEPLTQQDINDALSAAASVGDDRIQQSTQGRINPEGWTHGSSEQRQRWFATGYKSGDLNSCDTLNTQDL